MLIDRHVPAARIAGAARAGIALLQVRDRGLDARALVALARAAVAAAAGTPALVVVNDRLDVALAAGAGGVHLRGDSFPAADARGLVPPGFVIGRSVHAEDEAVGADEEGACDYLLFGTVFPSASKPPGHPAAGAGALRQVCRRVRMPVLAIGGITTANAAAIGAAGAAGAAAIGIFRDGDIAQTAGALRAALERGAADIRRG